MPKINENSKKGKVTKKIQCQDNVSKSNPAIVGPKASQQITFYESVLL